MKQRDVMRIEAEQEQIWTLSADRKLTRLALPDLPLAGLSTPLRVRSDFDAGTIDLMIERLTILRAQMLPKMPVARKRN
jgi:hypothetical protein